ncbi:hypothetical protein Plant_11 [Bacillus phage poppyseed]|uniref:Uncharacterized protein n=3 Tax=Pagevirus TaxID=1921184 RepID=U5Q009_9CAUD|nr:hypothetical protein Page_11 [Bacillus phage Page]YP_008771329.1 hypothetical protein Pony_11 [Bacillus phage Pony]YP_009197480.1 hypothetical protein AVT25_gp11 [Bacillus phage Pavlov]AGY48028.1 hypothetical protein Plant_11 [Bacillus phage poppyseed]AGY47933.1 hypothetical protein Page_11 [Bacillus phage Page]AGY48252.1 hypothetical protein Pony_11 [Bacillus phage Pony]AKQ07432.1 hypothetical protein CPT_Pavlov11 [Bacillus phage Pavlov]
MPVIKTAARKIGDDWVTEIHDSVGTVEITYTFLEANQRDTMDFANLSGDTLTLTINATVKTVNAYQTVRVNTEKFTAFKVKSNKSSSAFRARSSYDVAVAPANLNAGTATTADVANKLNALMDQMKAAGVIK